MLSRIALLITFVSMLSGCASQLHDKMILRKNQELEKDGRIPRNSIFKSSSFWELARTVEANQPQKGSTIQHAGKITFTGGKYHRTYEFDYSKENFSKWSLVLYEEGSENRLFSLHRNNLGLTIQDVQDQVFLQSHEDEVWSKLSKHLWFDHLKDALESLAPPKFTPSLDWHEETDGLKYYVLTRVEPHPSGEDLKAIKHELYFHKKARTLARHIKTLLEVGIVEDLRFQRYRPVKDAYLPHRVLLNYPKDAKRIDISIESTKLLAPKKTQVLQEL
jgi:hypothetical protein